MKKESLIRQLVYFPIIHAGKISISPSRKKLTDRIHYNTPDESIPTFLPEFQSWSDSAPCFQDDPPSIFLKPDAKRRGDSFLAFLRYT